MVETSVLIAGAGPVGLGLGLVLDRFGVDNLIVERRAATTDHPKAHGCHGRTMEMFRVWGIEPQVRAGGLPDWVDESWFSEGSAVGPVIGVHRVPRDVNTPAGTCMVTQDVIESALQAAVLENRHTTLRRRCELLDVAQDEHGVLASVRDLVSGEEFEVRAEYLVGCDGGKSFVRDAAGFAFEGSDSLGRVATYFYRADLAEVPHSKSVITVSVCLEGDDSPMPVVTAVFAANDGQHWQYAVPVDPTVPEEQLQLLSEDEVVALTRKLWGLPDLKVELINVRIWTIQSKVADHFRKGRVLLAGDAAHLVPPAGGFGMNSGFSDVQNLGWKLALVLRGAAPEALLDSYEAERRPAALSNLDYGNYNVPRFFKMKETMQNRRQDPQAWHDLLDDFKYHTATQSQSMGFIYQQGALIDDGSPLPPIDRLKYWPTDRSGARFPHLWLDSALQESTIDWFDTAFVLVCGPDAADWRAAGAAVAATSGLPLQVRSLRFMAGPISFARDGAVLVRPDGYVAWRPTNAEADKANALQAALGHITGRWTADFAFGS